MPSSSIIVPNCPAGIIFSKDDFLSENFAIDSFLESYAGNVGLENLRDDLGMYLQVLRVAMIELINDDYADFVNLSSNLVGIDEIILSIENPLKDYQQEILGFEQKLKMTKNQLEQKLLERQNLHDQRVALRNLEHIINLLNKVERLIGLPEKETELTGDLVERVAQDVNYLNHCVAKCESAAFVQEIQPRMQLIGSRLHSALEGQFISAVSKNEAEVMKRCLRIYASIDQISVAENLIRTQVVSPFLEEIITSKKLHSEPLGLEGICQNILNIVPEKLELLLQLTNAKQKKSATKMSDFNFVLNSLWPELVERFESGLPQVFSAGNPDQFHNNYITIVDFIKKLESVAALNSSESCEEFRKVSQNFIHRWNLSVYFQIRFQEIGGPVEEACQELFAPTSNQKFHLRASEAVMEAVDNCWKSNVFLKPLTNKFWKLTLQIIARYAKAVEKALEEDHLKKLLKAEDERPNSKLSPSPSASTLLQKPKSHFRSSSADATKIDQLRQDHLNLSEEELNSRLILVYLDVAQISREKFLDNLIWPSLGSLLTDSAKDYFLQTLDETRLCLQQKLQLIKNVVTCRIAEKCAAFLKQVGDIPRLYRRTNREIPTKACQYMISMCEPIFKFNEENQCAKDFLVAIFQQLTSKLLSNVSQVLDAVQKMEESLMRLRRVRNTNLKEEKSDKVSDDDKIRLQLLMDVQHYLKTMKTLQVQPEEVGDDLVKLERLVTEATESVATPVLADAE